MTATRDCHPTRVNRLRNRLIVAFLAATVLPLAATVWITTSLLDRSLGYATTGELDRLSRTLEATVRQFYQRERDALKQDALAGRATPTQYRSPTPPRWPDAVRAFWDSGEAERFGVSGSSGDQWTTCGDATAAGGAGAASRPSAAICAASGWSSSRPSCGRRAQLVESIEGARPPARVHAHAAPPARRGLARLAGAARLHRASDQPADPAAHGGLTDFAAGDWSRRLETGRGTGTRRRATRWAAPSTPSTAWPISCGRAASGSSISPRWRAGSRSRARPRTR